MKVSIQHRKKLVDIADKLFSAGINWVPMTPYRKPVTYYKGRPIQYSSLYYRPMNEEQHNFFKEVCMNTDVCAGISVISIVNGLIVIDFDPAKNPRHKLEEKIRRVIDEYGHAIYFDRRYVKNANSLVPKGLKIAVFTDKNLLTSKQLLFKSNYEEEVTADPWPPKTLWPSIRLDGNQLSAYVRLSHTNIWDAYYDKTLSTLREVMEQLDVEVRLAEPPAAPKEALEGANTVKVEGRSRAKPLLLSDKIDSFEKMVKLLKLVADEVDCPGFKLVIEHLEKGEWIVPYFMYHFGPAKLYRRSSYSIVENHIMETLAYIGVRKEVFKQEFLPRLEQAQKKLCEEYGHGCAHKTESHDISTAFKLKAFGHDEADRCIYKLLGLCPRDYRPYTFHGKVFSADPNRLYLAVKMAEAE